MLLNIDAPSAAIAEIERQERISEDVIRYLSVRVEELEEGPSAMMRKADRDREDRGGGFRGDRDGGFRGERGSRSVCVNTSNAGEGGPEARNGESTPTRAVRERGCCARAPNGNAATVIPVSLMKSRRRMCPPSRTTPIGSLALCCEAVGGN